MAAGLRALDRGRPVVVPGLRNRLLANIGGMTRPPGSATSSAARMLRPAQVVTT